MPPSSSVSAVPSSVDEYLRLHRDDHRKRLVTLHRAFTQQSRSLESRVAASIEADLPARRRALLTAFQHYLSNDKAPYQPPLPTPSATYIVPASPVRSPARARDLVAATLWSSLSSTRHQRYAADVVGGVKHNGASADVMTASERRRRLGLSHYVAD